VKFLYPGGGQSSAYGIITAPNHKGIPLGIIQGKPWAGDLGCSVGPAYVKKINLSAVADWLPTMEPYKPECLWIAGGDVVGDAVSTLDAYEEFRYYFEGWPVAYVAQNGAEGLPIPEDCAAVFIGGDTTVLNVLIREELGIQIGLDGNDFINNKKTMLAEKRLVQFVSANDTQVLVKGTMAAAKTLITAP